MDEECEHQAEIQSRSHSNLQDPAKSEHPTVETGEDMHPEVAHALQKQEEQQATLQERHETDPEAHELESEAKQEKEDQVETFFSSMSHRYEGPLAMWSINNDYNTLTYVCLASSLIYRTYHNYTTYINAYNILWR